MFIKQAIMHKKVIVFALTGMFLMSCETLQQITTQVASAGLGTVNTQANTYSNAAGLKEALTLGLTKSVATLSQENGYFSDMAIKIAMPEEASVIIDNIKLIPGGEDLVNDVVLRMNCAAEDAAAEATPIFVSAIKNMSFSDATSILFGNETAATTYLKNSTYSQLFAAFKPKVAVSLDKDLVGNISTNESWSSLTTVYNKVASSSVGKVYGLKSVNTDLSAYVTDQALNGLFLKVGNEEKAIRKDPSARVTTLLQKVFGQLDNK